jgi:hypothetical protein
MSQVDVCIDCRYVGQNAAKEDGELLVHKRVMSKDMQRSAVLAKFKPTTVRKSPVQL